VHFHSHRKEYWKRISLFLMVLKRYIPKWGHQDLIGDGFLKTVADHGPAVSGAHNAKSYS